jgi:hypothetical protein
MKLSKKKMTNLPKSSKECCLKRAVLTAVMVKKQMFYLNLILQITNFFSSWHHALIPHTLGTTDPRRLISEDGNKIMCYRI